MPLGMQTRFIAAGLGLSALALALVVAATRWARFLSGWLRELLPVVFSGGHCLRLEMGRHEMHSAPSRKMCGAACAPGVSLTLIFTAHTSRLMTTPLTHCPQQPGYSLVPDRVPARPVSRRARGEDGSA